MKQQRKVERNSEIVSIATCLVINEDGQLLLLKRQRDAFGGGLWATPGGLIEPGETTHLAMAREVKEETGIDATKAEQLGVHRLTMPHETVLMTSFLFRVPARISITLQADEHEAYAWFDIKSIVAEENIIWGTPTVLRDYGLLGDFGIDPTLADGSIAKLVGKTQ